MKFINGGSIIIECTQQSFVAAQLIKPKLDSFPSATRKKKRRNGSFSLQAFGEKNKGLLEFQPIRRSSNESFHGYKPFPKLYSVRRCCSENFDSLHDHHHHYNDEENGFMGRNLHGEGELCSYSCSSTSHLRSSMDILDPLALGIRPEAPTNWPERESIKWIRMEQEAKTSTIPNSLRMIQKKIKLHKGINVLQESASSCSMRKAFSSMMFIMFELQSTVLKWKLTRLCHEDLEMIMEKVQSDMQSCYCRLFQEVFSSTPAFMICIILLLVNFSLHHQSAAPETAAIIHKSSLNCDNGTLLLCGKEEDEDWEFEPDDSLNSIPSIQNLSAKETVQQGEQDLRNVGEVVRWNSFLEEAEKMKNDASFGNGELTAKFVSPISVIMVEEGGDCLRNSEIDIRYQIGLAQEPDNSVLLCSYAKFLIREVDDPERAEECLKKAVHVKPPDAESHCLYADFLWKVKNDLWGALEKYLEAVAADPQNSHCVSRYAEFLWRIGGEGNCYPLNDSNLNQPE